MYKRATQPNGEPPSGRYPRPSAVGHWTRTIGALVPLVIGEVVKDPEKRWRFIRVASVALAVISEGTYAYRVREQRRDSEERSR